MLLENSNSITKLISRGINVHFLVGTSSVQTIGSVPPEASLSHSRRENDADIDIWRIFGECLENNN